MNKELFILILTVALAAVPPASAEMRVSAADAMRAAIEKPHPEYTPMAKQLRISGDVVVEALVNEKGTVDEVKVVSGNAMLTQIVVTAVKKWKFNPFQENGAPTKAVATLKFSFSL